MPQMVFGEGSLTAKVCIIGEAPGIEEAKIGRPFIGKSGQLLSKVLSNVGIAKTNCYLTNVVKERPPGNNIGKFLQFGTRDNVTKTEQFDTYLNMLYRELYDSQANVFVPLGAVALYALTGLTSITKWRGSILSAQLRDKTIKIVPCIHPAAALRQYLYVYHIQHDLALARTESDSPEISLPARTILIKPSYEQTMEYLDKCQEATQIAFDIEVTHEEVSCISFALDPLDVISIPFLDRGQHYFDLDQEMIIWRKIASILADKSICKIGQNISFDATFLHSRYGIRSSNLKDSMVMQGVLYPDMPKGLGFLCSYYTREPYYKDDGKRWAKIGITDEQFWIYNAKDSACTFECQLALEKEAEDLNNSETCERQTKILGPLIYMSRRGILCDAEGIKQAAAASKIEEAFQLEKLHAICGSDLNPASPKQLANYFYITRKAAPYFKRGTNSLTTDEKALKRLSRKGFEEAKVILTLRHLSKLRSTYYEMELDSDNRIRSSLNPVGTKTGRISSSKTIFGTGGNMQNLPPEMLRYLLPDPSCVLYNMDLSQAENRLVAYLAPEQNMIKAFDKREDIHNQTTALIFGIPLDQVSDEPGSCPLAGGQYSQRFFGKKCNHSLNYDLGYKSFSLLLEIAESEAKMLHNRFHMVYPGVHNYHAWIRSKLAQGRLLENPMGRKRLFLDRWGDSLFKEAYAWIPQSTVADIINQRGLSYIYYNQELFAPVDLLNQVHDSIVFQIPLSFPWSTHAECLLAIKESLEQPLQWRGQEFTIPVDIEMGINLSKGGKVKVKVDEPNIRRLAEQLQICHQKLEGVIR